MTSFWYATAPSRTDRTRITLNFGLGRADRQLNELVVPQLGRIWFVRQLSWPVAALSLGERVRETTNVKPSAISHGLEALGCKLEWNKNPDSERILGKRAFGRDTDEHAMRSELVACAGQRGTDVRLRCQAVATSMDGE